MYSRTHASLAWRKSSFCPTGATCVEIANLSVGDTAMRDGKDPESPELHFTASAWAEFIAAARAGEFNPGSPN